MMASPSPRALSAFALVAVAACAAAALVAALLGLGPAAAAGFVGVVALGYAGCALAVARHLSREAERRTQSLLRFEERLAASATEAESRVTLLSQIQAIAPAAGAVLLVPNESGTLLTATFGERVANTPLRELTPERFADGGCRAAVLGEPSPGQCEICGGLPGQTLCQPLQAGGRSIGALLVAGAELTAEERDQIAQAARRGSPLLAAHRSREQGERHAAYDPLTELPNRRAADRVLRRLCAQAGRAISPVATILVELDGLDPVDDRPSGAAFVLAARRLTRAVRASDFVARYGTRTLLVIAPDTDRHGALELAEKLRMALAGLESPAAGWLTGSLGVASIPMDALNADELVHQSATALSTARASGGNCVRGAEPTVA